MPIIAYKTMNITAVWVQVRQIRCEGCKNSFRYLAIGTRNVATTGLPIVSSDEGMRGQLGKALQKALDKVAKKKNQGEGMCPHCQRYQGWMVSKSRLKHYGKGLGWGVAIGGGLAIFVPLILGMLISGALGSVVTVAAAVGLPVLGLVLGGIWAFRKTISVGPHTGQVDRRAMKDAEHNDFMKMCRENDYQPALAWYASIGGQFQEKVPVIPLADFQQRGG